MLRLPTLILRECPIKLNNNKREAVGTNRYESYASSLKDEHSRLLGQKLSCGTWELLPRSCDTLPL